MLPRSLLALLLCACSAHAPVPLPLTASEPEAPAAAPTASEPAIGAVAAEGPAEAQPAAEARAEAQPPAAEAERDPTLDDEKRCAPPERGWGKYQPYQRITGARLSMPAMEGLEGQREFEVYVHFHASDAVRRVFVHEGYPAIFVGVDRGAGTQSYKEAFRRPEAFEGLLAEVQRALREQAGDKAKLGRIYLSSWSAGSGATVPIAKAFRQRVSALVLLDSLYSAYESDHEGKPRTGAVFRPWVAPVLDLSKQAMAGDRVLFLTHTQVPTIGYASTGEVARYLRERLGVHEVAVAPGEDPRGQVGAVDRGGLHLRGFRGSDAKAHCNHLRYAALAMRTIRERWPGAQAGSGEVEARESPPGGRTGGEARE